MAAIGRKTPIPLCALLLLALSLRGQVPAPESETGKQSAQARAVLGAVSDDLAAGNATEALTHFADSMPNYATLSSYFNGLVSAFYVSSGIQIMDETDEPGRTKLTVRWDLTLTDIQSYYTEDRSAELSVCLIGKGGKWRISEFSPISLFDPGATSHRAKPKS
jgi:hypothetical protein